MLSIKRKNGNLSGNDSRKHYRISLKAKVTIRNLENTIIAKGKCINASLNGIGLLLSYRSKKLLSLKDTVDILIVFPHNPEPLHKTGRIIWYKKNGIFTYRSGIEFE